MQGKEKARRAAAPWAWPRRAAQHLVELVPVVLFGGFERAHPDGVPVLVVLGPLMLGDPPAGDNVISLRYLLARSRSAGGALPHHLSKTLENGKANRWRLQHRGGIIVLQVRTTKESDP